MSLGALTEGILQGFFACSKIAGVVGGFQFLFV